jgi:hypothetical protein
MPIKKEYRDIGRGDAKRPENTDYTKIKNRRYLG